MYFTLHYLTLYHAVLCGSLKSLLSLHNAPLFVVRHHPLAVKQLCLSYRSNNYVYHTGVKKLIFIHKYRENDNKNVKGNTKNVVDPADFQSDLLALIQPEKEGGSGKQHSTHKVLSQDDTHSLTELEKEAEQEVNSLTTQKETNGETVQKQKYVDA